MKAQRGVCVVLIPLAVMMIGSPQQLKAGPVYNAVNDYSLASNPNGQWSYLYDSGSGPQLLTVATANAFGTPGVDNWGNGQNYPNEANIGKNTNSTTVTLSSTVILPPNLLGMDPESNRSVIARWTAPSAGTWSITGLFQGIDTDEGSHLVEIKENSSTVLLTPTTMDSYGQKVSFNDAVTLAQGDTINFIVAYTGDANNLSTGLAATIQPAATPEPSSLVLLGMAGISFAGWGWRRRLRTA